MNLHVFNPEHDIALASFLGKFTAPHAGRQLRSDLGFLPALWAGTGDVVLVDDVDCAKEHLRHIKIRPRHPFDFVTREQLSEPRFSDLQICPWGWDPALKYELVKAGVAETLLPTVKQLSDIRVLSSREWACAHLQVGAFTANAPSALDLLVKDLRHCVIKSPWSSSGRGVRYAYSDRWEGDSIRKWAYKVIETQGCVTVEPYYNKVKDFGMEFESMADGTIRYCGLSLFHTERGAYTGNVIATEEDKEALLAPYVSAAQLRDLRTRVIDVLSHHYIYKVYTGPFGVDMMVYNNGGALEVNPCVEINLRRTMGHVALALSPRASSPLRLMGIHYDGSHYHLRVRETTHGAEAITDY